MLQSSSAAGSVNAGHALDRQGVDALDEATADHSFDAALPGTW
ncbi:MAG: hypothetical protein ACRDRH_18315 [Pseudonocardia sp.]